MKRVLLVRLSAMGDLVQSLGAVQALAAARPELELCLLTQRPLLPLLDGMAALAAVVPHDRAAGWRGVAASCARLRRLGCDTALDLQGNWKSALLARLSGARLRLGAAAAWRQEPLSRLLLTRTVPVPGPRHPAAVALALVRQLQPDLPLRPAQLQASEAEIEAAAAAVARLGIASARPFRVVVLADPADPRAQRPAALVRELARSELPVLLLAGPAEAQVLPPAPAPLWRQGAGALRQLVGLGCLLARVGGEVVGPDTGASHVLAACGASTTVLFGPQDPTCTAPPGARALRHPQPPACAPCRRRTCGHAEGPVCMAFHAAEGVELPAPAWFAAACV